MTKLRHRLKPAAVALARSAAAAVGLAARLRAVAGILRHRSELHAIADVGSEKFIIGADGAMRQLKMRTGELHQLSSAGKKL